MNPSYYGLEMIEEEEGKKKPKNANIINNFMSQIVDKALVELGGSYCVEVGGFHVLKILLFFNNSHVIIFMDFHVLKILIFLTKLF